MDSRKAGRIALAAAILSMGTGCYAVKYRTDLPGGGRVHSQSATFFIGGLIGKATVNLDSICPNGVARWENKASVLDLILTYITIGIYTPRTIEVECAGGSAYRLEEQPSQNVTEVTPIGPAVAAVEVAP
jgi:hypothetical protein